MQTGYRSKNLLALLLGTVGLLNVLASPRVAVPIPFVFVYLAPSAVFVLCYRALALADSPAQIGGYIPSKFLGLPRTRRLIFVFVIGYGLQSPIIIASYIFSAGTVGWRPLAMRAPQASLLLVVISTFSTAVLLQHRYRAVTLWRAERRAILAVFALLVFLAGWEVVASLTLYVFILSATAVGSCLVMTSNLRAYVSSSSEFLPSSVSIWSQQPF